MATNPNVTLRDYRDAAAIFSGNKQLNMPKLKRWFHVYFEIDGSAISNITNSLQSAVGNGSITWSPNTWNNFGLLGIYVKTANLPNFTFEVSKGNQYNRSSLTVTKIEYQPITIKFHDDTVSTITDFWYGYYQYMIQDPKYSKYGTGQTQGVPVPTEWQPSNNNFSSLYNSADDFNARFGLDTQISGQTDFGRAAPFFRSVRIYQFSRATSGPSSYAASTPSNGANYDEYVLVNPIIKSFGHEKTMDHSSDDSAEHEMELQYETVLYNRGYIKDLASWSAIKDRMLVDTTASPLGTNQVSSVPTPQSLSSTSNQSTSTSTESSQASSSVSIVSNNPGGISTSPTAPQTLNKQISVPGGS